MDSENIRKSVKRYYDAQKFTNFPDCGPNLIQQSKKLNFPVNKNNKPRRSIFLSKYSIRENQVYQENSQVKINERLAPIEKSQTRKRKSIILGKNKALLYMIENYFGSQTTILTVDKDILNNSTNLDKDGYESTVDNCCGSGFKAYQNDLDKNLMIEKFRLGNYKRNRRKSLI